ncbi:hypothetical protein HNQ91_004866 [Filimonas zeae]|uniref:Uncharacterized protein n=1 Tax=Filimonas zeae TaxID=1737353 RepID=A0A917J4W8_9BACT|nr:type VI secretion system baseplate subunit TssF [Filimonas zeae]MDR6341789.1 hypothetical protein [Filimonas zeae]GGH80323.1 hypothetical protein GCM10011379_51030 [Filimonas zeae]
MHENSEHIKARMLQAAARIWGYPEADAATDFDPLVSLLLAVNAAEFERLSNEIHLSRTRVLEKMVQLMAPEVLTGPLPASGVLYALSTEAQTVIRESDQFFYSRRISGGSEQEAPGTRDLFFTPAGRFTLNKCAVQYMATGNKLFRYTDAMAKELMAYTQPQQVLPPNTLWLGIDQPTVSLDATQFYFQIRNEVNKPAFYSQLPKAKWSIEGKGLDTRKGYNTTDADDAAGMMEQVLQQTGPATRYLRQIRHLYEHCFVSLADAEQHTVIAQPVVPNELRNLFAPQHWQAMEARPVKWIKVVFPENISSEMLEDVSCFTNCMPVVNRRLHDITYRLQDMANLLPLTTDAQFFDIADITDEHGRPLHLRTTTGDTQQDTDVLFRSGGAGRFDERDANMVIQHLVQLLRDESAAFSGLGRDLIAEEIRQLQQVIAKLEQLLSQRQAPAERVPYLVIRKGKKADTRHLFVKYWSTDGAQGNAVKAGTPLQPYKTGAVNHAHICLLTNMHGGKDRLTQTDSVIAYKQAVLSKDRIMSREDIRLYCLGYVGKGVKRIAVEKGVMVSADTTRGFLKTIDVTIVLDRKAYLDALEKDELSYWKEHLSAQLAEKSMAFMPFRIFIEEAA